MKASMPGWPEILGGQCFFLAAIADLGIREIYHRSWTEVRLMLLVGSAWIAWSVVMMCLSRRSRGGQSRRFDPAMRIGFVVAAAAAFAMLVPNSWGVGQWALLPAAALILAWLAALSARSARSNERWRRGRLSITLAAVLFVASQPVVGYFAASSHVWLSGSPSSQSAGPRSITVILLMDELNARSALGLAGILSGAGFHTQFEAVAPAGPHTAQAIPAMFVGHPLREARACGPTTMCSMDGAMDFSKVSVARADVDFVGFFHPYCAIHGLRYCKRSVQSLPLAGWKRWECLWRRQSTNMDQREILKCEAVYIASWVELKKDVLKSLWEAPAWTEGGTIYAHLPMPHPPGRTPGAGLGVHYRENLDEAASVLTQVISKAQRVAPGHAHIVVISDHPLRQSMWCATQFPYSRESCKTDLTLEDDAVPVIAAETDDYFGPLQGLRSNLQVFQWIATPRQHPPD